MTAAALVRHVQLPKVLLKSRIPFGKIGEDLSYLRAQEHYQAHTHVLQLLQPTVAGLASHLHSPSPAKTKSSNGTGTRGKEHPSTPARCRPATTSPLSGPALAARPLSKKGSHGRVATAVTVTEPGRLPLPGHPEAARTPTGYGGTALPQPCGAAGPLGALRRSAQGRAAAQRRSRRSRG